MRLLVNLEVQALGNFFDMRRQLDTSLVLSSLRGPGLPTNTDAHVHTGFLYAFRSVGELVLDALREQLEKYPQYDVAVCGKPHYSLSISTDQCFPQVIRLECVGFSLLVTQLMLFSRAGFYCVHRGIVYQEQFP